MLPLDDARGQGVSGVLEEKTTGPGWWHANAQRNDIHAGRYPLVLAPWGKDETLYPIVAVRAYIYV